MLVKFEENKIIDLKVFKKRIMCFMATILFPVVIFVSVFYYLMMSDGGENDTLIILQSIGIGIAVDIFLASILFVFVARTARKVYLHNKNIMEAKNN